MSKEQIEAANYQLPVTNYQLPLLVILLVAAFLRFYQLPDLPPGLNFDEAGNGVAALDILNGAPKIWWPIGGGKEPAWPYLVALSTALWGTIPFALRFPAALAGILTIAAVYPLVRVLFKGQQAQTVALFTALGLAGSAWHLHFSRLGFRAVLLPLFSTLAFYFFWTHLHSASTRLAAHRLRLVLAALFIALAIYSYLAARLLPLALILFLLLQWFLQRERDVRPALLRFLLLLILFLSPLIIYFLLNPADFVARSTTVSIFNPAWHQGDLPGAMWQTVALTLGTFLGAQGDANPLVNLPGQPALPWFLAIFLVVGILVALYKIFTTYHLLRLSQCEHPAKGGENGGNYPPSPPAYGVFLPITFGSPATTLRPTPPLASAFPYLFLLCWWSVMLLPALLAPEGAPHHLRLLGAIVPTYILTAMGVVKATEWLDKLIHYALRHLPSATCYLLPAACYLLLLAQTRTNYFIRWPNSADFTLPFDLYAARLAADIARAPAAVAYVLPMDIRAGAEARHYALDYLLGRPWLAFPNAAGSNYSYIPVDERNAQTLLRQVAAGKDELRVIRWTEDKHREADAKEIVTFLLAISTQPLGRESFPVYDVETYRLPAPLPPGAFTLPAIRQPVSLILDEIIRIDNSYVSTTPTPDNRLPVALTLAPLGPMKTDYKASLRLVNTSGERVAQKDRVLLHNFHQGTSLWPPETVNEYYLLPVPPDTPPGEYTVTVVIYHPDTLAPLTAAGAVEIPLGNIRLQ